MKSVCRAAVKGKGFVKAAATLWNSMIDPGQPCVMIRGSASGSGDFRWNK